MIDHLSLSKRNDSSAATQIENLNPRTLFTWRGFYFAFYYYFFGFRRSFRNGQGLVL